MNNKKMLALGLSALMLGSVLAGCGKSESKPEAKAEAPKYTFRLAETHPADYPTTLGDKKFADLVAERSNGRIKINVFHSAQLGEEKSVIEQVQMGSIEFTRVSSSPLAEFNKAFGVFSLPYIFDSEAHEWSFLEGDFAKQMLVNLDKSKIVGLAYYDSGSRNFYTKNKVTGPADLKGMKIRVQQNKINMDLIQSLGASATPMPYGEVFSGLQTGVIDGAENNAPSYLTANHFQAVKYFVLDAHQRVPEVLMASKATWDKLSAEDRKLIQQAATDSVKFQREAWAKFDKEALEKLKTQGITVTEVKDVKPWQAAVKPVIDKYNAEYKAELEAIAKARK
jgi:tripartite ATP-independent transporter DctP family solute receptor